MKTSFSNDYFILSEQSGTEEVGIKQGDLVRWYVSRQNELGVFSSTSEVVQEYRLVRSIIQVQAVTEN